MRFDPLSEEERVRIHEGALCTLEEVGLLVGPSSSVAARLRETGLRIAGDGRLLLPRAMVETALAHAPRTIRLGGRDATRRLALDGTRTYVATDGCGAWTIDLESGRRRTASLADVAASARLTDGLDLFHVYWMMVSAQDVPLPWRTAREFAVAIRNTTKHVQMIDVARPEEADRLVRMARALSDAGAADDPPVSMLNSVVSPLRLDPGGTEAALTFAAAGLPVAACSMPIASVTAPATAAGTVTLAHAEILGFITILQLLHPGAPVIYCSFPAFADPRTGMTNYCDPRRWWASAAATRMGRGLGLPCFTSGELASLLSGSDLLCFGGLLEVSTVLSLEQLVIDHEMLRDWWISAAPQGVDEDALALDVIRDVGPGGHFLTQRHTVRHIREFVVPRFVEPDRPVERDRGPEAVESGRDRARREARRLLSEHIVPPLPAAAEAAMARLAEEPLRAAG